MLSDAFTRHPNFVARVVGQHTVLVPVEGSPPPDVLFFLLDGPVALRLWGALVSSHTGEALVELVAQEFSVDRARAARDVATFLEQLLAAGCAVREAAG